MTIRMALVVGILCVLAGCGQTQPAETPPAGEAPGLDAAQPAEATPPAVEETKPLKIGVMPKLVGIDYFNAAEQGALEAAESLGIEVDYSGPATNDVQLQAQMIETWIMKKYDAIAVAPNDPDAIAPVLRKARKRGIKVLSWDADSTADSRDFFVNQCVPGGVPRAMMDVVAEGVGPDAKYLIITGSLTAANQNIWMDEMEAYRQAAYPDMVNLSETPLASEESQELATQVMADCLKTYPDLQAVFAITSVALPGAAEALRKSGRADEVLLTGLATPNAMKTYVADGTVDRFVLWSPVDLGYLTVHVAAACCRGELEPGATSFEAGRLGSVAIDGDMVILGDPIVFDASNIQSHNF